MPYSIEILQNRYSRSHGRNIKQKVLGPIIKIMSDPLTVDSLLMVIAMLFILMSFLVVIYTCVDMVKIEPVVKPVARDDRLITVQSHTQKLGSVATVRPRLEAVSSVRPRAPPLTTPYVYSSVPPTPNPASNYPVFVTPQGLVTPALELQGTEYLLAKLGTQSLDRSQKERLLELAIAMYDDACQNIGSINKIVCPTGSSTSKWRVENAFRTLSNSVVWAEVTDEAIYIRHSTAAGQFIIDRTSGRTNYTTSNVVSSPAHWKAKYFMLPSVKDGCPCFESLKGCIRNHPDCLKRARSEPNMTYQFVQLPENWSLDSSNSSSVETLSLGSGYSNGSAQN